MSSRHELSNGEEAQAQEAKVEKEGVLFLRASPVGHEVKWSHPYAKIIPGYMYLFQKPVDDVPLRMISLAGASATIRRDVFVARAITLTEACHDRYVFVAPTSEEATEWLMALRRSIIKPASPVRMRSLTVSAVRSGTRSRSNSNVQSASRPANKPPEEAELANWVTRPYPRAQLFEKRAQTIRVLSTIPGAPSLLPLHFREDFARVASQLAQSIDTRLTILFQRAVYELTQLGRLVPAMQAAVARASVSLATARNSARVQRERASKSAAELEEYKRVSTLSSVKLAEALAQAEQSNRQLSEELVKQADRAKGVESHADVVLQLQSEVTRLNAEVSQLKTRATASVSTLNAEKRSAQAVYDAKIVALEQELIAEKAEAAFRIAQLEKRNSELEDSVKVKSSEAETLQRRLAKAMQESEPQRRSRSSSTSVPSAALDPPPVESTVNKDTTAPASDLLSQLNATNAKISARVVELEGLLAKAEADLSSAVTTYAAQVAMEIDSRKELSQQELAALRDRLESEAKAERSSLEGRISDLSTKLAQANGEKASISSEFEAFRTSSEASHNAAIVALKEKFAVEIERLSKEIEGFRSSAVGSGTAGAGAPSPDPTPDLRSQAVAFEESEEAYKAEPIYTLLLEEAMAKEGPASTAAIDARRDLARALVAQGKLEKAEEHCKLAVAGMTAVKGFAHPETAEAISELAHLQRELGKLPEAFATAANAVDSLKAGIGQHSPLTGRALYNLALIAKQLSKDSVAETVLKEALSVFSAGGDSTQTGDTTFQLALLYQKRKDYDSAAEYFERACGIWTRLHGPTHKLATDCAKRAKQAQGRKGKK